MARKKKTSSQSPFPMPELILQTNFRKPKGRRGDVVTKKVILACKELLCVKSVRDVTVVEVATRAKVARASLLLQFPDGMRDILAVIASLEYETICRVELALWKEHPPSTPVESVCRLLDAIDQRAKLTGRLYRNLLGEALQNAGSRHDEVGAVFGVVALLVVDRSVADMPENESKDFNDRAFALGEILSQSAWNIAAGGLTPLFESRRLQRHPSSRTETFRMLATALVPLIRATCGPPTTTGR
jgi:AcrR family transcriptional regulator